MYSQLTSSKLTSTIHRWQILHQALPLLLGVYSSWLSFKTAADLSCKIWPWQKVAPRTIFCRKIWPPRPILATKSGPPLQNLAHPPNCSLHTHFWEMEKAIDSRQAWRSWWSLWFLSVLYKLSGHLSLVTLIALNNFCAVIPWALVVC